MEKQFNSWFIWLIIVCVISIFFSPVAIIAIIMVVSKRKTFLDCFSRLYQINDVDEYVQKQKLDADTFYHETTAKAKSDLASCKEELKQCQTDLKQIKKELDDLNHTALVSMMDFEVDEAITSEEYKDKLTVLKSKISECVRDNKVLDVSSMKTKKMIRDNSKQILRCFDAECNNAIRSVSVRNVDTQRNKINKSFETLNKIFDVDGVKLTHEFLEMKLEELNLTYAYYLKKEQEKEEQKAIREQMLEEEKVRREIEREKAKIEKEENQFKNEITKLMGYMQKSSDAEKQLYIDKIKELEEKLKLVEKDKENVFQREQNTRAGYVYVISNIGSFGEDIYKIGMTRRLEPMDRVKELGDASVPFEFDVHAMIFSDDAPKLESVLHSTFRDKQVNKVNPRKEFFHVSLSEIEKVVKENHNATVEFTQIAKAEQYRESLRLASM